jgi:hypothetical protein
MHKPLCHTTLTLISHIFPINSVRCLSYLLLGLLLGSNSLVERKGLSGLVTDVGVLSESQHARCAWPTGIDRHALHASVCEQAGVACEALFKVEPSRSRRPVPFSALKDL